MPPFFEAPGTDESVNSAVEYGTAFLVVVLGVLTGALLDQITPWLALIGVGLTLAGIGLVVRTLVRVARDNAWSQEIDEKLRAKLALQVEVMMSGRYNAHDRAFLTEWPAARMRYRPRIRQVVIGFAADGIHIADRYDGMSSVEWDKVRKIVTNKPYLNFVVGKVDRVAFLPQDFDGAVTTVQSNAPGSIPMTDHNSQRISNGTA